MNRNAETLRRDVRAIWQAGVEAVRPENLIPEQLVVVDGALWIGGEQIPLDTLDRILVVGGGKAGASMVLAVEAALGPEVLRTHRVSGLVNVPEDCLVATRAVQLHAARPAGVNEPTPAGVAGADAMLRGVAELGPRALCLVLLSGGGSALLPAPWEAFALADKLHLTRALSARGASIFELNAVRRELSRIKGGGLARACRAGRLAALILSDVLGDDLSIIASGPTLCRTPTPQAAVEILRRFGLDQDPAGHRALELLERAGSEIHPRQVPAATCRIQNVIIGNNATAVDASGMEAERRGYSHAMTSASDGEGTAEEVAGQLVGMVTRMRTTAGPDCLISGGEPTVVLAPEAKRGLGGRNQQLCLAGLVALSDWHGAILLSGGTDGEDGPTDAAGAFVDAEVCARSEALGLDPSAYLRRNDAYRFFAQTESLLRTGPTHTNVCDLRIALVQRDLSPR